MVRDLDSDGSRADGEITADLLQVGDQRARKRKVSEEVARELAVYIVENQLEAGTPLPPEHSLVNSLGVGRATIREALRLLESMGAITIKVGSGGGPRVRIPDSDDLSASLSLLFYFSSTTMRDVGEARAALEPRLAALAARRINAVKIEELDACNKRMRADIDKRLVFFEENSLFHKLIADASGSHILAIFSGSLKSILDGSSTGIEYPIWRREAIAKAHDRILMALGSRDARESEEAMAEHLREANAYWARNFPEAFDTPIRLA
jgi:GntR family transcriptional regulator, transcriptional repressor for pyruvate dehydrogenase complex